MLPLLMLGGLLLLLLLGGLLLHGWCSKELPKFALRFFLSLVLWYSGCPAFRRAPSAL